MDMFIYYGISRSENKMLAFDYLSVWVAVLHLAPLVPESCDTSKNLVAATVISMIRFYRSWDISAYVIFLLFVSPTMKRPGSCCLPDSRYTTFTNSGIIGTSFCTFTQWTMHFQSVFSWWCFLDDKGTVFSSMVMRKYSNKDLVKLMYSSTYLVFTGLLHNSITNCHFLCLMMHKSNPASILTTHQKHWPVSYANVVHLSAIWGNSPDKHLSFVTRSTQT